MFLGNDCRVDIEVVADEGQVDPGGIAGIPCKYVNISFQELNQFLFLLERQPSPYSEELLRVVVNDHLFQVFAFRVLGGCVRGQNRGL